MASLGILMVIFLCGLQNGSGHRTGHSLDTSTKDWELVFRGVKNSGDQMYVHWIRVMSPAQCRITSGCVPPKAKFKVDSSPSDKHLKSMLVDKWICLNVKWVKIEVYSKGSRVAYFIFNGTGSSRDSWLDDDRLMESNYVDLNEDTCFTHSTISGSWYKRFMIGTKADEHDYCYVKRGWLLVMDQPPSYSAMQKCDWIKKAFSTSKALFPRILYAKGSTNTVWEDEDFGEADQLAIYISRKNKRFSK